MQTIFVALGIVLGLTLTRIQSGALVSEHRSDQILGAVGFGIIGLVSVIYSLLFLVVQSSNTTFTPRLNLFQDDPWIWRTYAIALGLFAYSMTALLAVGDVNKVSMIVPIFAFATALAVIGLIRWILMSAFASLQLSSVIDRLSTSGRNVINELYRHPVSETASGIDTPLARHGREVLWTDPQATLQQLDLHRLATAAERTDSVVVFQTRVGEILWEGSAIATVDGSLPDEAVIAACVTGLNRTFNQDPLLAFRLLADIGLRALSPAVNDPATAAQTLDAIVGLLDLLGSRYLAVGEVCSPDDDVRIQLQLPTWDDFVREGLDDLLAAAGDSPMMVRQATMRLRRLAEQVPPARRPEIDARLAMIGT